MTTITSNGYYLIADKRTTITCHLNSNNKSRGVDEKKVSTHSDESCKINVLGKDSGYTIDGKRILAWASAGNGITADRFMSASAGIPFEKFAEAYSTCRPFNDPHEDFCIVMITEHHHTWVFNIEAVVTNGVFQLKWTLKCYSPGTIIQRGSGQCLLTQLTSAWAIGQKEIQAMHPLQVHMFGAGTDSNSSTTYDVYGVKEDKLHLGLEPAPEAVQEALDSIGKLVSFKINY